MFTGIIEETGVVKTLSSGVHSWKLTLSANQVCGDLAIGDSLAVNGCCLTVTAIRDESGEIEFDLLEETVRLTSICILGPGSRVNLERSLLPTTRMGGHFVTGHIDGTGEIIRMEPRGKDIYLEVKPPPEFLKYLAWKGSVAIDGISLTVAVVESETFAVWLIPHTLEVTNLVERRAGEPVNLEFDLLAKYVDKQLEGRIH